MWFFILISIVIVITIFSLIIFCIYCQAVERVFKHHNLTLSFPYSLTYEAYADDIDRKRVEIVDQDNDTLVGYYYWKKGENSPKALIIVSHGFNSDHTKYMPEISVLISKGYLVFSYDNSANGESEGDDQYSLYHSAFDAERVLNFITKTNKLPLGLYGHSWGAFAVLAAAHPEYDIKCVVARSGFQQESQTIVDGFKRNNKIFSYILRPYARLFSLIINGRKTNTKASDGIIKTPNTKFLLLHSQDDDLVFFHHSAAKAVLDKQKRSKCQNAKVIIYENGGHLLLFTAESSSKRRAARRTYADLVNKYDNDISEEVIEEYKKEYPLTEIYEINHHILKPILEFFDENLTQGQNQ